VSGQLQDPAALTPGKEPPGTHWIGGWVGPRAGLDDLEKRKFLTLPGLELRPLGRQVRRHHRQVLHNIYIYEITNLMTEGETF
jgi:hypothetical protein